MNITDTIMVNLRGMRCS